MPIQFRCTSCSQPIEIDNEFAGQAVTCPYCSKVVTSPGPNEAGIVTGETAAQVGESGQVLPPRRPAEKSLLSWVSLVCTVLSIVVLFVTMIVSASLIGPTDKPLQQEEVSKRLQSALAERPALRYGAIIAGISICGLPIVGTVLAISALVGGKRPRWPAVVALCIAGLVFFLLFGSVVAKLASQTP
jgi:hypothetical protein